MAEPKKYLIIFAIAVLFSILVFTTIDAVYMSPEYSDYCKMDARPMPVKVIGEEGEQPVDPYANIDESQVDECYEQGGMVNYDYDENGIAIFSECDMCSLKYDEARDKHSLFVFIISSILGILAIVVGMRLPSKKKSMNEWVGTGFMLGGIFTIFVGTAIHIGNLHRVIRPFVILLELILVLWLAYRKPKRKKKLWGLL